MMMTKQQTKWACAMTAGVLGIGLLSARVPAASQQQPTDIAVVISGDPGTPPRYAVPDFVALTPDAADAAKTLGQVLWDDLNFEREFYLIPRDTYGSIPPARRPEDVPFGSWRELGADAVLMNSGIAHAENPVLMAEAMKHAVIAGRAAYLAGRMPRKLYATASSPMHGVVR